MFGAPELLLAFLARTFPTLITISIDQDKFLALTLCYVDYPLRIVQYCAVRECKVITKTEHFFICISGSILSSGGC
jgi:hypothetical protein